VIGDHPLPPVGRVERDPVARPDSERMQPASDAGAHLVKRLVGQHLPAGDQGGLGTEPPRRPGQDHPQVGRDGPGARRRRVRVCLGHWDPLPSTAGAVYR
jgi:hypothetical protein